MSAFDEWINNWMRSNNPVGIYVVTPSFVETWNAALTHAAEICMDVAEKEGSTLNSCYDAAERCANKIKCERDKK